MVSPDMLLDEVIAMMGMSCVSQDESCYQDMTGETNFATNNQDLGKQEEFNRSCVLVVESSQLVGVFTLQDLIRVVVSREAEKKLLQISEVMTKSVITLQLSEVQDIFTPLLFFRQHQIRHIPIVDNENKVLGIVTPASILQALQPSNLLRLGTVKEVMTNQLMCAIHTASVLDVAKLMALYRVSCVVITQTVENSQELCSSAYIPLGVITEQKILQALILGRDLATIPALSVMRRLGRELNPVNSLLYAYQQMQSDRMETLLVSERQENGLGVRFSVITQMEILRSLEPAQIYQRLKKAQQSVQKLQVEKTVILQSRNAELEQLVQQRTAELREALAKVEQQAKQAALINQIVQAMRGSLVLDDIWKITVNQLQEALKVSRCLIFRPNSQNGLTVSYVSESTSVGESFIGFECDFYRYYNSQLVEGISIILPAIHSSLAPEIKASAQKCGIRSLMIVPLFYQRSYIGGISLHECDREREWTSDEVEFVKAIADHCAIAIHQAELYQKVQTELKERQKVEAALRVSEQQFHQLAKNLHQAFFIRDIKLDKTIYISSAFEEIWGMTPEVVYERQKAFLDNIHPEDRDRILASTQDKECRNPYHQECRIIRPDGEIRWVLTRAFPLENDQGEIYRAIGIIEDITERKQAEILLKEQKDFLQTIIDTNPNLIFLKDRDGKFILVNQACADVFGKSSEQMLGKTDAELISLEQAEQFHRDDLEVITSGQPKFIPEETISTPTGEVRWLQTIKKPLYFPNGQVRYLLGVATDITERKQAETALKTSEQLFRSLSECSPVGIFVADIQGHCIYTNPRCQTICGFTLQESLGEGWAQFIHPEDFEKVFLSWQEVAQESQEYFQEYRFLHKDGNIRWVNVRTSPLFLEAKNLIGYVGTIEDITRSKLAQEQLKSSLQEKEVLLKEVHHRVKNNLQIIYSLLDLQSQQVEDTRTIAMFQASQNRIRSMALIHEKLYRSDNMNQVNIPEYITTLTNYLLQAYALFPNQIKVELNIDNVFLNIDTAIPCGLIINELVSNALKHAFIKKTKGTITVELKLLNEHLLLIIQDDGDVKIDLKSEENKRGLGIKLVKILVHQIEGALEIEQSQGTKFTIKFNELKF